MFGRLLLLIGILLLSFLNCTEVEEGFCVDSLLEGLLLVGCDCCWARCCYSWVSFCWMFVVVVVLLEELSCCCLRCFSFSWKVVVIVGQSVDG